MASIVRIKRSEVSGNPSVLGQGELAYSALIDNGINGGDRLYIGMGTETNGNAVNHVVIGGKYFTDIINAATSTNTASTLVKRDGAGNFSANIITATLVGNSSTATKWATARDLSLTGDATATLSGVDGGSNASGALTLATVNNNPGTFGSATQVPIFAVNAKGLVTSVTTAAIASSLNIAGDSGTDIVSLLNDTLTFVGGVGITSSVTNNTVTFDIDNTVATLTGTQTLTNKSISGSSNTLTNIGNSSLVNSSLTIGSSQVSLGGTVTSIFGLTELQVDNLNLNGNSLSATDTNGNVVLVPNGTGVVDVTDSRIVGVATPVNATDAANKAYVDNAVTGLSFKQEVNLKAVNNIALTGSTSTLTIDGHSALDQTDNGYRILLTGQTNSSQNGIYVYSDNGTTYALTRATDADTYQELIGASVFVIEGVTFANTGWVQTNHYLTSFSGQVWSQFSGAGTYVAGQGLTLTGTTFDIGAGAGILVNADSISLDPATAGAGLTHSNGVLNVIGTANRITVAADSIDIASNYAGQTSITTVGTITSGTWNGTTIATANGGTGLTSVTSRGIMYGNNSSTVGVTAASAIDGSFLREDATGNPYWSNSIDGGTY